MCPFASYKNENILKFMYVNLMLQYKYMLFYFNLYHKDFRQCKWDSNSYKKLLRFRNHEPCLSSWKLCVCYGGCWLLWMEKKCHREFQPTWSNCSKECGLRFSKTSQTVKACSCTRRWPRIRIDESNNKCITRQVWIARTKLSFL